MRKNVCCIGVEEAEEQQKRAFVTGRGVQRGGCRIGDLLEFVVHTFPTGTDTQHTEGSHIPKNNEPPSEVSAKLSDLNVLIVAPGMLFSFSLNI